MAAPSYEVYKDKASQWRWRLTAANGEIVAQSEGYTTEKNARRGVKDAAHAAEDAIDTCSEER